MIGSRRFHKAQKEEHDQTSRSTPRTLKLAAVHSKSFADLPDRMQCQ
jgi:hypothetical protein